MAQFLNMERSIRNARHGCALSTDWLAAFARGSETRECMAQRNTAIVAGVAAELRVHKFYCTCWKQKCGKLYDYNKSKRQEGLRRIHREGYDEIEKVEQRQNITAMYEHKKWQAHVFF